MLTQTKTNEEANADDSGHIAQRTISGLGWTLGTQVFTQSSQFLITVVLARLLSPTEFGLLAMVTVFTGFANLFGDFGFGPALIQREEITEDHLCSVFWVNLGLGVFLAGLTAGISPFVARFYHEPRLVVVMEVISLNFPINSLGLVQRAKLAREMNFRALGLIDTLMVVISGVTGIALALGGSGVWSLVCQGLLYSAIGVFGSWWASGWRPRFKFSRASISELFGFSANLTGFTAINYWYRNGDNLLVGRFFGTSALGIYSRAYNLMMLPLTQVTYVISKVMFPALARLQNDLQRVRSIYLRSISIISLITFPLMLGLLVIADHFTLAVYGSAWRGVVPILRIFCALGLVQSIYSTVGWIYQSQGRTGWMFLWGVFSAALSIAGMIAGVWLGSPTMVAICLTVVGILLVPPGFAIPGKLIGLTFRDVAVCVSGVFACAGAMACSVFVLGALLPTSLSHWICMGIEIAWGIVTYMTLIHVFQLTAYRDLLGILRSRLRSDFFLAALPPSRRE